MAETTSNVPNPGTGQPVRELTTPASTGVQQVVTQADGASGTLASILATGAALIQAQRSQTDTLSRIAASTASAQVLAANPNRLGFTIETDPGSSVCYVTLGAAAATTSNRTVTLQPGDYWEGPFNWAGAVQCIWSGTSGGASVHELAN